MPVTVDAREPERIKKVLRLNGIKHTVKMLETGDVICSSDLNPELEIVIERKRIDDLISSYVGKRMDTQFERLSQKKFAVLIITGDVKSVQRNFPFPIMPDFIGEVISKAIITYNFRSIVWMLKGIDDINYAGFSTMIKAINLVVKGKLDDVPERHIKTAKDLRVDSLRKTLGLNSKICINLLKKYGNVINVLQLKDNDFLTIGGIGPAHMKRIRFILNANYNNKEIKVMKNSTIVDVGNISGEKCKVCGSEMKMKKTAIGTVRLCTNLPHGLI